MHFTVQECIYGTPYYITIEERNKLYHTNTDHTPALAVQRVIFVFQCMIGCRVGDCISSLEKGELTGSEAEVVVAEKTKQGRL